jgi:hypothetical protein
MTRWPFFLVFLVPWLLAPATGRAALSEAQARQLLVAWIEADRPDLGHGCLRVAASQYVNGGYTVALDASACVGAPLAGKRWRIDAATTEVFVENAQGKYVLPPSAAGRGALANLAFAAGHPELLPEGARVIEYAPLGPDKPQRAYVLWMVNPTRQPHEKGENYTCPDYSRGSSWSGPTRLSLLDTGSGSLRNTIRVEDPLAETDSFDVPYRIPGTESFAYFVPEGSGRDREGRPQLLRLRDLDGDGAAREFFLATTGSCMLTLYAVFGYDAAEDAVAAMPVTLASTTQGKTETGQVAWLNFWPVKTGGRQGRYRWEVDLRGRAGCLERYDVAFEPASGRFVGRLAISDCQE